MSGPLRPDQIEEAKSLYGSGYSLRAIAHELASTPPTVRAALIAQGVKMRDTQGRERRPKRSERAMFRKVILAPKEHFDALKEMAPKKGFPSLLEYIRHLIRKELESTGALEH
jgi:hypothetical protein